MLVLLGKNAGEPAQRYVLHYRRLRAIRRVRAITVRIACIQLTARRASDAALALDDALAGIAAAAAHGARLAVLPECTYPGYVLLRRRLPGGASSVERALCAISQAARRTGVAVCIGVARSGPDGELRNEAVYFNRSGEQVARYAKFFLWNFDREWFSAGNTVPTFETEFGRIGMMICADGRMPEIARTLTRRGAWLVLDPTAWVSSGATYESMRNPQVDYMMSVRARENGIWIAAADKCGSEHGAVHYVGNSMIVAPDGSVVASADARSPSIVIADVQRGRDRPFVVALSAAERRALARLEPRAISAKPPAFRLGVLQGPFRRGRATAIAALQAQGVGAIVDTSSKASAMRAELRKVRGLRVSIIPATRMLAPEPPRAAAIDGADVLVWIDPPADPMCRAIARTRALENRVYVVVCERAGSAGNACVIDPDGAVTGEALIGTPSGFVAAIDAARARDKTLVPETDAFSARIPRVFALFDGTGA